ncbi:hypothetical protein A0H81_11720 [Grifola frondosa]|uniref:Uncharacterized protein n=1 Tax=Grifola frondosa TaxID=5627 RepID=A0A1C7LVQ5_GRIFR|nr:hypothetical protein A0H81_11720 [Grifola frondosa]
MFLERSIGPVKLPISEPFRPLGTAEKSMFPFQDRRNDQQGDLTMPIAQNRTCQRCSISVPYAHLMAFALGSNMRHNEDRKFAKFGHSRA